MSNSASDNLNSVGGSSLYNMLLKAKESFDLSNFTVGKDSSVINSKNTFVSKTDNGTISNSVDQNTSQTETELINGSKQYQYDMFDRLSFGDGYNSVTGFNQTYKSIVPRIGNISNRVVINYKNKVTYQKTDITKVDKDGKTVPNSNTFINKIITKNLFEGNLFRDPSIDTIVSQLGGSGNTKYPAAKISYADFLYCKRLGAYPNNRLVILRRFFQPMDDDLFESKISNVNQSPLSVMITWFDEFPLEIKYGENWESKSRSIIEEFGNAISSLTPDFINKNKHVTTITDKFNNVSNFNNANLSSPWLKTLFYQFVDNLYRNNSSNIPPNFKNVLTEANPNLIRSSVKKLGLSFELNFPLNFTYVMRYINGIDPHVAMHNIIANGVRMGTSTSVSIFPKSTEFPITVVNQFNNGEVINAMETIYNNVSKYLSTVFTTNATKDEKTGRTITTKNANKSLIDIVKGIVENNTDAAKTYARQLFSLYRFNIVAAIQSDMGLPSGSWHVTVGNPFNPIVSVGDLIPQASSSMTMKFNNELSYDDRPTEVTFTITLQNARPRGAQEIEQMFNAGKGRIYVYPQYDDDPDLYLSDENVAVGNNDNQAIYSTNSVNKNLTNNS